MSLASKSSHFSVKPLLERLQDEVAYWMERVESSCCETRSKAWEIIRKRQAQIMKLSQLHQRQRDLKAMQRNAMRFA